MLKEDLETYIKTRYSGNTKECFKRLEDKWIPASSCGLKTYIVKWQPNVQLPNKNLPTLKPVISGSSTSSTTDPSSEKDNKKQR